MHDSQVVTVEINPATGGEFIKYDFPDRTAFDDIALITGDAVHNLKSALDYTWLEAIERLVPAAVGKFAKFPIRQTIEELKAALRGREIDVSAPRLFDLVVTQIQPCKGGNSAVWSIHTLDIRDKHRLLIPVLSFGYANGIEAEEHGEIFRGYGNTVDLQHPPYYIEFKAGIHVKEKGHLSADIVIENPESEYVTIVPETLREYSRSVLSIVELFERFMET